ncbi:MAG TPA: S41 family peptidase [Patescibacteria group bacterium]|nr:S41 family peptidase [Patescibacteria group bacterium]
MNTLNNDFNTSEQESNELKNNNKSIAPLKRPLRESRRAFFATVGCLIFLMGMSIGFILGILETPTNNSAIRLIQSYAGKTQKDTSDAARFDLFWKVWDRIHSQYVNQPVNDSDLVYGAIAGMVSGLKDPHSLYFNPKESQEFMGEINGDFEGIGAEIGLKNDQLVVIAPLAGSPAEQAGLQSGDVILAIDNLDTAFMTLSSAVQHIRGEKGTIVTLHIQRTGKDKPFDVAIQRDAIHVETVRSNMVEQQGKRVAVITISQFTEETPTKFVETVNALLLKQPDGLVIDLRNNPGGYLVAAIEIASQFIEEGTPVVYKESGDGSEEPFYAKGSSPLAHIPTVIVMNEGSASASEILGGALQDTEKASLIGTTSFGKGTVQDVQTFDDNSSLKLTIARWLTPKKNSIDTVGIHPDFFVNRTAEDFSKDQDPQMDAALLYFSDPDAFHKKIKPYSASDEESRNP